MVSEEIVVAPAAVVVTSGSPKETQRSMAQGNGGHATTRSVLAARLGVGAEVSA